MATDVVLRPDAHRFDLMVDGERAGHLDYRDQGDRWDFRHTEVDPARKGQGLGDRLVAGALALAREHGHPVVATCPFVVAYLERHPEERDGVVNA